MGAYECDWGRVHDLRRVFDEDIREVRKAAYHHLPVRYWLQANRVKNAAASLVNVRSPISTSSVSHQDDGDDFLRSSVKHKLPGVGYVDIGDDDDNSKAVGNDIREEGQSDETNWKFIKQTQEQYDKTLQLTSRIKVEITKQLNHHEIPLGAYGKLQHLCSTLQDVAKELFGAAYRCKDQAKMDISSKFNFGGRGLMDTGGKVSTFLEVGDYGASRRSKRKSQFLSFTDSVPSIGDVTAWGPRDSEDYHVSSTARRGSTSAKLSRKNTSFFLSKLLGIGDSNLRAPTKIEVFYNKNGRPQDVRFGKNPDAPGRSPGEGGEPTIKLYIDGVTPEEQDTIPRNLAPERHQLSNIYMEQFNELRKRSHARRMGYRSGTHRPVETDDFLISDPHRLNMDGHKISEQMLHYAVGGAEKDLPPGINPMPAPSTQFLEQRPDSGFGAVGKTHWHHRHTSFLSGTTHDVPDQWYTDYAGNQDSTSILSRLFPGLHSPGNISGISSIEGVYSNLVQNIFPSSQSRRRRTTTAFPTVAAGYYHPEAKAPLNPDPDYHDVFPLQQPEKMGTSDYDYGLGEEFGMTMTQNYEDVCLPQNMAEGAAGVGCHWKVPYGA